MKSFEKIIGLWPTAEAFAQDIGVTGYHARTMKRRNNVDQKYWVAVVEAAKKRGFKEITFEALAHLAAQKRPETPPSAAE